jgi:hypothetical protein
VRRPLWFRSLITLWGIWFATALTEPAGFLACPMHSGVGHHATASPVAAASTDHSGHDTHGAVLVQEATESDAPTPAHLCSCLGDCCSSTPARAADPVATPPMVVVRESDHVRPAPDVLVAPTRRDHALPFAIGPPTAPLA